MKPYLDLTVGGQFRRFREAATEACRQFNIDVVEMKPLNHGENTTFRVLDTSGEKHVIRIHRPGYQTLSSIDSELKFLEALNDGTDLNVPKPRNTPSGEHIVEVSAKGVEGTRFAVALNWIGGRFVDERATKRHLSMTGELTATLHNFAETWKFPKGFDRRVWDGDFTLSNAEGRLGDFVNPTPFFEACALMQKQIGGFSKEKEYGLIHADLHFGNVFFTSNGIAAIDFDDLGFAHFAYDRAVTLTSYRRDKRYEDLREAYGEGYEKVRPLPKDWQERVEIFMAARLIFMVDWFFTRDDNPGLREYRDKALPKWSVDLERYLATGSLREGATESAA